MPNHTLYNRTGIVGAMVRANASGSKYTFYDTATSGDIGSGNAGTIADSFILPVRANHWVTLYRNKYAKIVKVQTL